MKNGAAQTEEKTFEVKQVQTSQVSAAFDTYNEASQEKPMETRPKNSFSFASSSKQHNPMMSQPQTLPSQSIDNSSFLPIGFPLHLQTPWFTPIPQYTNPVSNLLTCEYCGWQVSSTAEMVNHKRIVHDDK